jgi:hypothetical protein
MTSSGSFPLGSGDERRRPLDDLESGFERIRGGKSFVFFLTRF